MTPPANEREHAQDIFAEAALSMRISGAPHVTIAEALLACAITHWAGEHGWPDVEAWLARMAKAARRANLQDFDASAFLGGEHG